MRGGRPARLFPYMPHLHGLRGLHHCMQTLLCCPLALLRSAVLPHCAAASGIALQSLPPRVYLESITRQEIRLCKCVCWDASHPCDES